MTLVAGAIELRDVMMSLAVVRPIFHSEADFQFAFAQEVRKAAPEVQVRLEVRQADESAEYLDLACWTPTARTLIEFKYATVRWQGLDPAGEQYRIANHAAFDLTRRYFLHDVRRLERFVTDEGDRETTNGLAILLSNAPTLWQPPTRSGTRDSNFRLTDGATLEGELIWGSGNTPQFDQRLDHRYPLAWEDYSDVGNSNGRFRWLGLAITPSV